MLGAVFAFAVRRGMRADNPVWRIPRHAYQQRERRLSGNEYRELGNALRKAADQKIWPAAVAAVEFLALTGWRRGEALWLKWSDLDLDQRTAILAETKTGRSIRPLSQAACGLLKKVDRLGDLVFAASRGDGAMTGFPKFWARVAKLGPLPGDVTRMYSGIPSRRSPLTSAIPSRRSQP
jgi:integrase